MTPADPHDRFALHFPNIDAWDHKIFLWIYQKFEAPRFKKAARIISFTADPRLWALWITIFGIYGLITGDYSKSVIFFFGFFQTFATYQILKKYYKRPRPFQQIENVKRHDKTGHGYSFPSGHVHHSAIFVILLGLTFVPKIWFLPILFLFHALIAFSRLINGCHFPTDTIVAVIEAYIEIGAYWFLTKNFYITVFNDCWAFLFS